jgi:hypothetical protein
VSVKPQRASVKQNESTEAETTVPAPNSLDGSADGSMDGALAGATGKVRRRINSGTLILGGVIVASGVSLWSMRAIDRAAASGPTSSKEIEDLVKGALDGSKKSGSAENGGDPKAFVDRTQPPVDLQVPAEQVQKNPFVVFAEPTKADPTKPVVDTPPVAPVVDLIAEWQTKVDAAAGMIRLQSTMSGQDPQKGLVGLANINGHMMRLGDVFGVEGSDIEFRLDHVERDAITVRAYSAELKHERLVTVNVMKRN